MNSNQPWQRTVIGSLAILSLVSAAVLYGLYPGAGVGLIGMLVRIGLVLGTIWLAMPQLLKLRPMQSAGAWVVIIGLLLVAARSPNLFRVAVILLIVGLAVNFFLKGAGRVAGLPSEKTKYK